MFDAKTLLFIDDEQAQVAKLNVLAQYKMCSDQYIDLESFPFI